MGKNNKVKNFQEEFSLEDIRISLDAKNTYNCGMSRIALMAPDQVYRINERLFKTPESASCPITFKTLKFQYALQVWCKAVLISSENPSNLLYYWWLDWVDGEGPFRRIEYHKFYYDITVEQLLAGFWELLEDIANSGTISVFEGYWIDSMPSEYKKVKCEVILNKENSRQVCSAIDDVYVFPYNKTPVSFGWEDIKGFFVELTLDQLRLTMPKQLHRHSAIDDVLLKSSSDWDIEGIKFALDRGAYINCLDEFGSSAITHAVEFYTDNELDRDLALTRETLNGLEKKCVDTIEFLLEQGADINLYGYDSGTPLMEAYYSHNVELVKFLLDKGANPNTNSYLTDSPYWPYERNVRSSVLDSISGLLPEDYDEKVLRIELLIYEAGGRHYVWDFTPWNNGNIGKFVIVMEPAYWGFRTFLNNDGTEIGDDKHIVIEDENDKRTTIKLPDLPELRQWSLDYRNNLKNINYDWKGWKSRGLGIAKQVAAFLPDNVALFYLDDDDEVVKMYEGETELSLVRNGNPIRIK